MSEDLNPLRESLATLELALETPFIPGELVSWFAAASSAVAATGDVLRHEIVERHPDTFAEIFDQDPGLAARIDELRLGDEKSLEMLTALEERIDRLSPRVSQLEPDEGRAGEQAADVRSQGLEFVIHARSQETALGTWFAEAFSRDRGTVD